MHILFRCKDTN